MSLEPLSFIAKMIGVTARVGGAFALAALAVYWLRNGGVEPFAGLDAGIYQIVVVGGLIGAGTVGVELLVHIWKGCVWLCARVAANIAASKARHERKELSLKNLHVLTREQADALFFMRRNNLRRFPGRTDNRLLFQLWQACLLEIDDANFSVYSGETYFTIPQHIWDLLEEVARQWGTPIPSTPPWIQQHSWMGY